ncbi:MAG TPA: nitrilase-related carbon-nitrogen hydrolase [Candidatus Bathyarchaeia archaeon]|nr:nitrilase-related carbon-nitrogen hydrolase [Candidatus Bathyarchaeia archaeon]
MKDIFVAAYQMDILTGDKTGNITKVELMLQKYHSQELDLLVLPELFSTGFAYPIFPKLAEDFESSNTLKTLNELSEEYHTGLAGSILCKDKDEKYQNIGFIISPSKGLVYKYQKIHLWGTEKNYFSPGKDITSPVNFENKAWIGLAICYDLRFPEVYRRLAIQGAEILLTPAAWPAQRWEHFILLTKARALENTCYHISCNRIGKEESPDYVEYNGNSQIISPMANEIIGPLNIENEIVAKLTAEELTKTRKYIPVLKDRQLEI